MKPMLYVIGLTLLAITLMVGLGGRCDQMAAALAGTQLWCLGICVLVWLRGNQSPVVLGLLALYLVGWFVACLSAAQGPLDHAGAIKKLEWALTFVTDIGVFGWWARWLRC